MAIEGKKSIGATIRRAMRDIILAAFKRKGGPHSMPKGKRGYNRKQKYKETSNDNV